MKTLIATFIGSLPVLAAAMFWLISPDHVQDRLV